MAGHGYARTRLQGEAGQILPGLLIVLLALLAVGVMTFQVGKAAVLRSEAQTAADAAALAGASEIRRQLIVQFSTYGATSLQAIDYGAAEARMRDYAKRNGGTIVGKPIFMGVDVKVTVSTDETLGKQAEQIDNEDTKGMAKARARVTLVMGGIGGMGGNVGPVPGGGGTGPAPKISEEEWKDVAKDLDKPPQCADVITLGKFLQEQGFLVGENSAFGPVGKHDPDGYHFKCGNAGALDVNFGGIGDFDPQEIKAVDPIIEDLRDLGFRTIWRAPGHNNHLHVDIANSGPIGAGSGGADGGFTGPLEDALLEVRLIDYEAPAAEFFGLGGVGGGYFGGPPDPEAARAICSVARDLGASPKVLLAAYEAAIVESGVHSLPFGDLDSIGLFQQRDSWGTRAQRLDPVWASRQFISKAIRQDKPWFTPGQLAQDVQISDFPLRYDERRGQAMALIGQYCSGKSKSD